MFEEKIFLSLRQHKVAVSMLGVTNSSVMNSFCICFLHPARCVILLIFCASLTNTYCPKWS